MSRIADDPRTTVQPAADIALVRLDATANAVGNAVTHLQAGLDRRPDLAPSLSIEFAGHRLGAVEALGLLRSQLVKVADRERRHG